MENSIEEDIKIIENFINWLTIDFEYDSGNEIKTIEHILSDYKRVLKENEELKAEMKDGVIAIKLYALQKENEGLKNQEATARKINELLVQRYSNSISLQKVKDKIEEINKMIAYEHNDAVIIQLGKQKRVLQKLLESEE
jgi:hypothetical protein|nr:MAG TPA: hypothetical protein [Caudoviricetes sp.]